MAAILRVFIAFPSVLKALNLAYIFASLINRYSHCTCTAHPTNRGWFIKPSKKKKTNVIAKLWSRVGISMVRSERP